MLWGGYHYMLYLELATVRHLVWPLTETKCGASWMETSVWCSAAGLMFWGFLPACSSQLEVVLHHLQSLVHCPFFETMSAKVLAK